MSKVKSEYIRNTHFLVWSSFQRSSSQSILQSISKLEGIIFMQEIIFLIHVNSKVGNFWTVRNYLLIKNNNNDRDKIMPKK